jgi:hypothetical protein
MDSALSPDIEAYWCYLALFAIALAVAGIRVRRLLQGFANIWATAPAWLLLAAYTAVPVVLFWLLDRADALHDTSIFAAILIAVTYQQILTGGSQGMVVPGGFAKAWQPFVTWSDNIAAGISARIARNNRRYDDKVIHHLATDGAIFEKVRRMILNRSADPGKVQTAIEAFSSLKPPLDDAGVQERKASYLYYALKALPDVDSDQELRDLGVISKREFYLYAREWSSKLIVVGVMAALIVAAGGWWWFGRQTPIRIYEAKYHLWRFGKANATAVDRFRAEQYLKQGLREGNADYIQTVRQGLTERLGFQLLPVETADKTLKLLLNQSFANPRGALIGELADDLRTDNPDVRSRTQKELVYLGDEGHLAIPAALRNWNPGKEDAPACIDAVASAWVRTAAKSAPEPDALACLTATPKPVS